MNSGIGAGGSNYRLSMAHKQTPKLAQVKVEDLDINKVIDSEKAISNLGGEQLYKLMLPQAEGTSLIGILEKLAHEINVRDWDQIKFQAHSLKGTAGYIGASRLHYACYWIQRAHIDNDT